MSLYIVKETNIYSNNLVLTLMSNHTKYRIKIKYIDRSYQQYKILSVLAM